MSTAWGRKSAGTAFGKNCMYLYLHLHLFLWLPVSTLISLENITSVAATENYFITSKVMKALLAKISENALLACEIASSANLEIANVTKDPLT